MLKFLKRRVLHQILVRCPLAEIQFSVARQYGLGHEAFLELQGQAILLMYDDRMEYFGTRFDFELNSPVSMRPVI